MYLVLIVALVLVTLNQGASATEFSVLQSIKPRGLPSKPRIIGGEEVTPHSHPSQVALIINGNAFCSGTLVSPNYVLTAAHCGEVIRSVNVVLGAHNISAPEPTQVTIPGKLVIIHQDYDTETLRNDITLIQLSETVTLNDNIQLATLPALSDKNTTYENEIPTASGWGLSHDIRFPSTNDLSDVLLAVDVQVIDTTECGEYYNDEDGDYVVETNVCTSGYKNRGTCNGDSGGPLTLDGVLIGITSFGTELCELCSPSVYTKVASYVAWIVANSDVKL